MTPRAVFALEGDCGHHGFEAAAGMRCLYGRPIRFHGKLERVDNRTSTQVAADLVNQAIFDLMLLSINEAGRVRRYFDIGALGYGATAAGLEGVESALGGGLAERGIVGAPELADHPRQFEMEQRYTPAPEIRPPIWIELCLTIEELGAELYEWVSTGSYSELSRLERIKPAWGGGGRVGLIAVLGRRSWWGVRAGGVVA